MKPLKQLLSNYSRTPLAKKLGLLSRRYTRWAENHNYDIATNGEQGVLQKLGGLGLRTFFDVGANLGNWSGIAHRILPETQIHCFEIVPETAVKLAQRFRGESDIRVNHFGLGNADQEVIVNFYPDSPGLSSLIDYPHHRLVQRIPSSIQKGDTYCRAHSITQIDFLKIDVEGTEGRVLEGFKEELERRQITIIQFEYGTANILEHFLLHDAYAFLARYGFTIGKIFPRGVDFHPYSFLLEDFLGPNYLAVQNERTDLLARLRHP